MTIVGNNFNEVYYRLLIKLATNGVKSNTRKMAEICELFDQTFIVRHPTRCLALCRNLSIEYLEKELDFYMSGSNKLSDAVKISPFWNKCTDDGETINSNYGKLLFHDRNKKGNTQFEHAVQCLLNNRSSKKAVMTLYDKENAFMSNDNPCTMFLRARIDERQLLHLSVFMRSSDIYYGLPYDVPFFVFVQYCLVRKLQEKYPNLRTGEYRHTSCSLHKYSYKKKELDWAQGNYKIDYPDYQTQYAIDLFEKHYEKLYQIKQTVNLAMERAWKVSEQAQCLKKKVGACFSYKNPVTLNERFLVESFGGVVGPPCKKCARDDAGDKYYGDECPSVHAEMKGITALLKAGITDFSNVTVYVTHGPCDACLKLCNLVGIKRVVYDKPYKTNYKHWPNIEVVQVDRL